MKKFYLFLMGAMMATAASAQKMQAVQPSWELYSAPSVSKPMKAASLEGTDIWGYFTKESLVGETSIGLVGMGQAGEVMAGFLVPCNGLTKGAKVQGVRVPIALATSISEAELRFYKLDAKTLLASKTLDVSKLNNGFNDVVLDEPLEITEDFYAALDMVTTGTSDEAKYPILFDGSTLVENSLVVFGTGDYAGEVMDYGTQFGAFIMQLYLSDLNLNGYDFTLNDFSGYTEVKGEGTANVTYVANTETAVNEVSYTVSVAGGEPVEYTTSLSVSKGLNRSGSFPVTFTAPEEGGNYTVEVTITKVNGSAENEKCNVGKGSFANFSRLVKRPVVMEEMTGTGCPWCTRGIAGMEKCRATFGDDFIGIAYHLYNNTDPMYPSAYPKLGMTGAPSCILNRSGEIIDPYYGVGEDILDDVREYLKVPAYVEVDAEAAYQNEDRTYVDVTANVKAIIPGTYEMVYELVADGLTGASFLQYNNYASYTTAQAGVSADDPLAVFCKGGELGKSPCKPIFNDVSIAASYVSNISKGGKLTFSAVDEEKTGSYSLKMPVKANLLNAIKDANYDVYAVVLAIGADKQVVGAKRVKVELPAGIHEITASDNAVEVARYTLDGRQISAPVAGVNVIRMSDGTCRKELVK